MKTTYANRCPSCKRMFTTPQGLGLHFSWLRRKAEKCAS